MSNDLVAVEDAIRVWVKATTGLPDGQVFMSDQDVPFSEQLPRVSIRLGGLQPVGVDGQTWDYNGTRPAGAELVVTASAMKTITVDLQCFSPVMTGSTMTALAVLSAALVGMSLPSVTDALNAAGLGCVEVGTAQRLHLPRPGMTEDRAIASVQFLLTMTATETATYIQTAVIQKV